MAEPRITNPGEIDINWEFERVRRQQELTEAQERILTAQMAIPEGWFARPDRIRYWGEGGGHEAPTPPKTVTGGIMVTFLPEKEEIDQTELRHVRNWISDQATGKKKDWPGFPLSLRVNGKSRFIVNGAWACYDGDTNLHVGNAPGVLVPIWAPAALMAIARCYRLDDEKELVKLIREMLAMVVAKEVLPVMTEVAAGFNGSPVTEIAVNKKERIFVGRYPDEKGNPGPFRHLTGEVAEINTTDWVVLKM